MCHPFIIAFGSFSPHIDNLIFLQISAPQTNTKPIDVMSDEPNYASPPLPPIVVSYQLEGLKLQA